MTVKSPKAMPPQPKLAWRNVLLGDRAINPVVTNGPAAATVATVFRKERREYLEMGLIL